MQPICRPAELPKFRFGRSLTLLPSAAQESSPPKTTIQHSGQVPERNLLNLCDELRKDTQF